MKLHHVRLGFDSSAFVSRRFWGLLLSLLVIGCGGDAVSPSRPAVARSEAAETNAPPELPTEREPAAASPPKANDTRADAPKRPARVALVSSQGKDAVRNVLDLAVTRLSDHKEVELLERAAIDRVLAEQKLSLAGLVDAEKAITIGKLLKADLFAVVETSADGKEAFGLIVYDAQKGIRLCDATLPEGEVKKIAEAVAAGVRAAAAKHARGLNQLKTVGLLTVRNADLPRELDSMCEGLALILERRLLASESVAVLERKRLEHLNKERDLPTGTEAKELLASTVLLELEVGRAKEGDGLRAMVVLTDGGGRQIDKITAEGKGDGGGELVETLQGRILKAAQAVPAASGDCAAESKRFMRQAQLHWSHKQYLQGLQAIESAYALEPKNSTIEALLASYLIANANYLLDPSMVLTQITPHRPKPFEVSTDTLKTSLRLAHRGCERTKYPSSAWHYLADLKFVDSKAYDDEARRMLESLHQVIDRVLMETVNREAGINPSEHMRNIRDNLPIISLNTPDSANYAEKIFAIVQRWLETSQNKTGMDADEIAYFMEKLIDFSIGFERSVTTNRAAVTTLGRLFEAIGKHPHPFISLYGRYLQLFLAKETKHITPEEFLEHFKKIKKAVLSLIENPPPDLSRLQLGCYSFLGKAIRRCLPTWKSNPKFSALYWEEYVDICEFMLARREVADCLFENMVTYHPATASKEQVTKMADIIAQTIVLAKSPDCQMFDKPKDHLIDRLSLLRKELLAKIELPQTVEPPWENVRVLFNLYKFQSENPTSREIDRIESVTISTTHVYLVGSGRTNVIQAISVSLDGGAARLLGKIELGPLQPGKLKPTSCASEEEVYVATYKGIYSFKLKDETCCRIDQNAGLPSEVVEAMTFLDGKLYAALEGGYLVAFEPGANHCQVLASSRRKEKSSPWDDGPVFKTTHMVADPKRHRILFTLEQRPAEDPFNFDNKASGLWEFDSRAKKFTPLLTGSCYQWGSPLRGDHIIISVGACSAISFDLDKNKPNSIKLPSDWWPPVLIHDGWLWFSKPYFGRMSLADSKQESFPPLDKNAGVWGERPGDNCIESLGNDQLLIGCSKYLWLVKLKKMK